MDGDVTITDKFGQIRGTFIKTHENSAIKELRVGNGLSFSSSIDYAKTEFEDEFHHNVAGKDNLDNEWQIINTKNSLAGLHTEGAFVSRDS